MLPLLGSPSAHAVKSAVESLFHLKFFMSSDSKAINFGRGDIFGANLDSHKSTSDTSDLSLTVDAGQFRVIPPVVSSCDPKILFGLENLQTGSIHKMHFVTLLPFGIVKESFGARST